MPVICQFRNLTVCASTYSGSGWNMLSKNYSLELNDKEVDKLLHIIKSRFKSLLWDLVVSSWADGTSDARADSVFGGNFSKCDN